MAATSSSSGGGSGGGSSSSGRDAISLRGPTEPGSKAQRLEWPGFESRSLSRSLRLWRQYIWITLDDPTASRTAQCVSFFLITAIVMSIANFSVGSYPTDFCGWRDAYTASAVRICASDRLETHPKSKSIEMFCVIVFTLEYLIRLLTVTSQSSIERFVRPDGSEYREAVRPAVLLRRFLVDPMNLLDLAAVLPWYILLVIDLVLKPDGEGGLQKIFGVVRLVRLTRILRIFKVSKSMKMMIVLFRTLVRSRSTLLLLLAASLVLMLAFGAFAVVFERGLYNPALRQYVRVDGSASPFLSIPEAMYWCMTTMTTVGYGDLYPITPMGWLFGVLCALTGIIILSLPITVIGATFQEEYEEQQRIAERERRLNAHTQHITEARNKAAEEAANATSTAAEAELAPESLVRRFGSMKQRLRAVSSLASSRSIKAPPPIKAPGYVPGAAECEWLLEDYRENCENEMRAMIAKGEDDLMRMARKVIIHSRILSSATAREGEEGPDGGESIR